ncbi:MAG: trypsin-like peptidase domain-containing protein, partial [Anaerolineae bacterium]|nr:trypsin-like peptidase domain-containing protein [Anaerolineae bacterium]
MSNSWRRWTSEMLVCVLVVAVGISLLPGLNHTAQAQEQLNLNNIFRATVFVASVYDIPGGRAISCVASGTLVSSDGLILTNAHNVIDSERCQVDDIAISLTVRLGEPPVPQYFADVVSYDLGLDLAVLRIARQLDGRDLDTATLTLPYVELGDSTQVTLDDTIAVVGYPDLGDDPVTFSRGTILGFMAEPRGGERAWLKTSATILGTMSGGGAYDREGRLIGVPTTAPASSPDAVLDCRRVQDTNADGLVDNRDSCIPVGGSINALRPAALARGLVRAAQLGIRDGGHVYSAQVTASAPTGEPRFGPIRFAPAVNEAGLPTTLVTQMPAGTNSLYLFFDYENMQPGLIYELRTTINGATSSTFSQSPALWSGQQRGLWYIGSSGQPWPNGTYEFTLFIEGRPASSALITIGGGPTTLPTFSDVVFGLRDFQNNILGTGYVLPVGNVAYARFIYRDMAPGMTWTQIWTYEGIEIRRNTEEWSLGTSGSTDISIQNAEQGLLPGRYR